MMAINLFRSDSLAAGYARSHTPTDDSLPPALELQRPRYIWAFCSIWMGFRAPARRQMGPIRPYGVVGRTQIPDAPFYDAFRD